MPNTFKWLLSRSTFLLSLFAILPGCSEATDHGPVYPSVYNEVQTDESPVAIPEPMGQWGESIGGIQTRILWAGASRTSDKKWKRISFVIELENMTHNTIRVMIHPTLETNEPVQYAPSLPYLNLIIWDDEKWCRIESVVAFEDDWTDEFKIAPRKSEVLRIAWLDKPRGPQTLRGDLLIKAEIGAAVDDGGDTPWTGLITSGPCSLEGLPSSTE